MPNNYLMTAQEENEQRCLLKRIPCAALLSRVTASPEFSGRRAMEVLNALYKPANLPITQ